MTPTDIERRPAGGGSGLPAVAEVRCRRQPQRGGLRACGPGSGGVLAERRVTGRPGRGAVRGHGTRRRSSRPSRRCSCCTPRASPGHPGALGTPRVSPAPRPRTPIMSCSTTSGPPSASQRSPRHQRNLRPTAAQDRRSHQPPATLRCGAVGGRIQFQASGAVDADQPSGGVSGDPAAVVHQETRRAGELVGLLRNDRHGQYLPGQVRARQVDALGGVALLQVDVRGPRAPAQPPR